EKIWPGTQASRRRIWSLSVEDRGEPSIDHALAVEGHFIFVGLHTRVGHQLGPGFPPHLFGRPLDPAEDNRLTLAGVDRAAEIGDLAVWHVIAPALDHAQRAIFSE